MSQFERFLAGDDALSRLIRNQPAFEPSAEQDARILAAIAALPQTAPAALDFEPPAHMEAAFLQQMHVIAQAQAPRRDTLMQRLEKGEAADAVLGHPVSDATQTWLASQQAAPASPVKAAKPGKSHWWQLSGMVLASALVAGIGFQLFFPAHKTQPAEIAFKQSASSPAISAQENIPLQLAESLAAASPAPEAKQTKAPPDSSRSRLVAATAAKKANTEQESAKAEAPATSAGMAPQPQKIAVADEPKGSPQGKPANTIALARESVVSQPVPTSPPVVESRLQMAAAPMPAPVVAAATPAKPALMMARKAAIASAPQSRSILLSEDPRDIARNLSSDWAGQALILHAADPQSPVILDWVARLRAALPSGTRLTVLPALDLGADRVVLIRP